MTPGGIEPNISGLKGRCRKPLDHRAKTEMSGLEPEINGSEPFVLPITPHPKKYKKFCGL